MCQNSGYIFLSINYKIVKKFLYLLLLLNILFQYAFFSESMSIWIYTRLVETFFPQVCNSHLIQTTIFTFTAVLFKKSILPAITSHDNSKIVHWECIINCYAKSGVEQWFQLLAERIAGHLTNGKVVLAEEPLIAWRRRNLVKSKPCHESHAIVLALVRIAETFAFKISFIGRYIILQ